MNDDKLSVDSVKSYVKYFWLNDKTHKNVEIINQKYEFKELVNQKWQFIYRIYFLIFIESLYHSIAISILIIAIRLE